MEDTLKAGHYENRKESVDIMIRSSRPVIEELIAYGVDFARTTDGKLAYTREGCHSKPRILFHEDITGKEITSKLLAAVQERPNITILDYTTMLDIIEENNRCLGIAVRKADGQYAAVEAGQTILASGGVGGLYKTSTNYPHLTGDALAIALNHNIELEHISYVQIHPTSLYSKEPGRSFLISESVRGEGAKLRGKDGLRFANEVLPRDVMTAAIHKQMEKDDRPFVWLDMTVLGKDLIYQHFPHIYERCLEEGIDCTTDWVPVVPAQHYFMGGIHVDCHSRTTMENLYAVGETSCNGVHGRNRLASNSLLESLVFGKRAAEHMAPWFDQDNPGCNDAVFTALYEETEKKLRLQEETLQQRYKAEILQEMEKEQRAI
jgi:L-aspartate oxidase